MTREQIREIFRQHRGAAKELSYELGVSHVAISRVLSGKDASQRILDAARARAAGLVAKETIK